jgi:hypothetical protein
VSFDVSPTPEVPVYSSIPGVTSLLGLEARRYESSELTERDAAQPADVDRCELAGAEQVIERPAAHAQETRCVAQADELQVAL